jgi:hypothetical protein
MHDTRSQHALSTEQVVQVLRLLRGVDSVELKVSVHDADRRSAVAALDIDPLDAQIRQVTFFDTPDLVLDQQGVVLRARRVQGRSADSVVKLRPVVPEEIPSDVRRSPDFGVELDAMPGGYMCSGAMKASHEDLVVKEVMAGRRPVHKVFSKVQRALFAQHAPAGLELDDLSALGPINVVKLKMRPEAFGRRLVAELWSYPDGSRLLELSTKCDPTEAFQVAAETRAFLAGLGIDLSAVQQTKTRTALEFYAQELDGAREPTPA